MILNLQFNIFSNKDLVDIAGSEINSNWLCICGSKLYKFKPGIEYEPTSEEYKNGFISGWNLSFLFKNINTLTKLDNTDPDITSIFEDIADNISCKKVYKYCKISKKNDEIKIKEYLKKFQV